MSDGVRLLIARDRPCPGQSKDVPLHSRIGLELMSCSSVNMVQRGGRSRVNRNRRFPEITGKDNLTVFSYSGRVKSPECRRQRRRADLRQFQIFRHGPIVIYTRLLAGKTYYPICTFPTNSECLIGISDAFSAFCLRVSVMFPTCSLNPQQKRAYSALHPQAYTGHACRQLPSAVRWISKDRLLWKNRLRAERGTFLDSCYSVNYDEILITFYLFFSK